MSLTAKTYPAFRQHLMDLINTCDAIFDTKPTDIDNQLTEAYDSWMAA